MELINVDYNVVSLLNDLVNMVQVRAEEKGLVFEIDVDKNIPQIMHGDEIRMKQVITNILSNAVKYTKEGSIVFSMSSTKCEDSPDEVILHVQVKDTGVGIKKEDLEKLFVAFERIEEKKNRNIEGTGLGMAIAQSFLNMMGSKIVVESEYGKGSVFSFDLRQKVVKWEPLGEFDTAFRRFFKERKQYKAQFTAPKARILVVDDTEVNLKVFISLLAKTGMQIETADSGDACIELFKRNFYDVIFLDHMMPNKDGIETLKEMKGITDTPNKNTPVICLTANAVSGMREMYIEAGFTDYLTKPIDTGRLESMLLMYLPADLVELMKEDSGKETASPKTLRTILVVDEDVAYLKQVQQWLSDEYKIVVAKTKEQAQKYLEKHEAELILADEGFALAKEFEQVKIQNNHFKEFNREELISRVREVFQKR
jgi:CheY-like chemotaxis protein